MRSTLLPACGLVVAAVAHCSTSGYTSLAPDAAASELDAGGRDAGADASIADSSPIDAADEADAAFARACDLPGSRRYTANGVEVVPGGGPAPDLSFLTLPNGFCVHYFGNVGNARQIRFAPSGELFVASPTTSTTGGGGGGQSAVIVLPDDNDDGVADEPVTFLSSLPSTQGIAFAPGSFFYQDGTNIMRVPYVVGNRAPSGAAVVIANFAGYQSQLHWPKTIDIADDGTVYFANGGDQSETCDTTRPFHGGILSIDGSSGGAQIAKGLRNPIALRCARGHDQCYALELSRDYSAAEGGRNKMVPIHAGDDWGYPCCASKDVPFSDVTPTPSCGAIAQENVSFVIGETPFGLDFETGAWPAPWTKSAFVVFHGASGSWTGARIAAVSMDPATGLPVASSDVGGTDTGGLTAFATGWDDGTESHGRPAAVAFSADGRMFVANDHDGTIVWIAPIAQ